MKRIVMMFALTALLVVALSMSAFSAFAAPPPCEPGAPGCKTESDPDKNNPKFLETQRGNTNAQGTEGTERDCKVFGGSHQGEIRCR
jgi:hypothetical protein